jgi:hypothetical protein
MAKRQHFTNSKVGVSNLEPLYDNLFEVVITPPDIIANNPEWSGVGRELLLENITAIRGLDVDKLPNIVTQNFKGSQRNFIANNPDDTTVTVSIDWELNLNEANQNFVYNALRSWSDLLYDPLTAARSLKAEYVSPAGLSVTNFHRKEVVNRKIEIKNIFVAEPIPAFDKNYGTGDLETLTISFIGDYFNNAYNK